jgi:hypothetical protein
VAALVRPGAISAHTAKGSFSPNPCEEGYGNNAENAGCAPIRNLHLVDRKLVTENSDSTARHQNPAGARMPDSGHTQSFPATAQLFVIQFVVKVQSKGRLVLLACDLDWQNRPGTLPAEEWIHGLQKK